VVHTSTLSENLSDEFGQDPDLFHVECSLRNPNDGDGMPLGPEALKSCGMCHEDWERRRELRSNPSLRMMDVFCGGGGMSQSFVRAGAASVEWGIDFSPSACETFR
jgi:2-polyprenyl-3-methyl-5-hydroxy-6-metoxy-1,4-benzoquinol methylase